MRSPISGLAEEPFDVVIIGAGVNGTSAAQQLTAAGYRTLLVDKGDFASGTSGMSSRLLHCGLRYLAPGSSMWDFVRHPGQFKTALRMARQAMQSRTQMVKETPQRVRPLRFCFPIWRSSQYRGWQVDLAFKVLAALDKGGQALDYRRITPAQAKTTPLVQGLRDFDRLESAVTFTEYQFEWPDRICMDTVLDAARMGTSIRNYTAAQRLDRLADGRWQIQLRDQLNQEDARVTAAVVLNTAGIWIDRVAALSGQGNTPRRRVLGTKGAHIMVQLPPECRDLGIVTLNREDEPFYCIPWRGMHYFGPTETVYEGDPDDIHPLEEEVAGLLDEANYLLPNLGLRRKDVLFSWAGVRPLTWDPDLPKGNRSREIYDYAADGMPNVLAMTAGPIMTHRSAGKELLDAVAGRIRPSMPPQTLSWKTALAPNGPCGAPILPDCAYVGTEDLVHCASHEHVVHLNDLMFRRSGLAWGRGMGADKAMEIATLLAPALGWDETRKAQEVQAYRAHLRKFHLMPTDAPQPSSP